MRFRYADIFLSHIHVAIVTLLDLLPPSAVGPFQLATLRRYQRVARNGQSSPGPRRGP